MKVEKDIDKLFKDGLEDPDIPFNDLDWDDLEGRLHPKERNRIIHVIWFTAVAGFAALLLIVFLFVKPNLEKEKSNLGVKSKHIRNKNTNHRTTEAITKDGPNLLENGNAKNKDSGQHSVHKVILQRTEKLTKKSADSLKIPVSTVDQRILTSVSSKQASLIENAENINTIVFKHQNLVTKVAIGEKERIRALFVKKPRLVLSILAAPDLTSVQKSGNNNLSGGFGIEATIFLTKRLSFTTGASYIKKIYNSNYVFENQPTNIHANCNVMDIPLNANYKVFDNRRNSIMVSTGLSSYLMLKEKYNYYYTSAFANGPQNYEVKNQNQYFFGVVNVGVEFQHKINNKISISARPFMKLPLKDIGYGDSKFSSTGVAISVNMGLFSKNN